ncbi:MAG TPA: site-specific integrase [Rhodopila sp.]|nr:site-specific integrase [Rhodopila sp.]
MTTLKALLTAPKATLASLSDLIAGDPAIPDSRRAEMLSALKTLAKVLGRPLHMIPAEPADMRTLINRAVPIAAGISGPRWRNVKSLVRKALARLDPQVIPARSQTGLLPEWHALIARPEAQPLHRGLSRFSKYCSLRGLPPKAVTQAVYDAFYDDLFARGLMRCPRETQQTAGRTWNTAVTTVPGWPSVTLTIADFRRNASLPWGAFPASLQADVEAYLTPRDTDPFNLSRDAPTLRPTTIAGKKLQLRQFATALVQSGREPASILTLADLVDPQAAEAGLRVLWERANKTKTSRNYAMAYLLLTTARHWVKASPATLKALETFSRNLNPKISGMRSKNKTRLRQFDNPRILAALLTEPGRAFAKACRVVSPTKAEARQAQLALAIEILLFAIIRVGNLAALEIGRTLILDGSSIGHIVIDGAEVKNDWDIELPLPKVVLEKIRTYLDRFHPLLAPPGCKMLFPSADGGHKRSPVLGTQITRFIRARCGIEMNPHLFRHLAAKLYLYTHPGDYGIVRLLLGHKSIDTTMQTYCGTEHAAAFKAYDAFLTGMRGDLTERAPMRYGQGQP